MKYPKQTDLFPFGFQDGICTDSASQLGFFHCLHLSHIPNEDVKQRQNI